MPVPCNARLKNILPNDRFFFPISGAREKPAGAERYQYMRFRPCIDLHDGKVKQIRGNTLSDANERAVVVNFETDDSPSRFARMFRDDCLAGGHVIMLGPGNSAAALEALGAFPGGLQAGGGITPENARAFLDAGASHVIVTSFAFRDGNISWENIGKMTKTVGKKRLVLDLSCTKRGQQYFVAADRWQTVTRVELSDQTFAALSEHCDEFLVHAADIEGRREGIDTRLVELLARVSGCPVTYAGGARSLHDLDRIERIGNGIVDATIGSALDIYGGTLRYRDVVVWHNERNRARPAPGSNRNKR
jgi:phosphoribosylformimino-5-aminoimidazole carboxamide ribotide isomerase